MNWVRSCFLISCCVVWPTLQSHVLPAEGAGASTVIPIGTAGYCFRDNSPYTQEPCGTGILAGYGVECHVDKTTENQPWQPCQPGETINCRKTCAFVQGQSGIAGGGLNASATFYNATVNDTNDFSSTFLVWTTTGHQGTNATYHYEVDAPVPYSVSLPNATACTKVSEYWKEVICSDILTFQGITCDSNGNATPISPQTTKFKKDYIMLKVVTLPCVRYK